MCGKIALVFGKFLILCIDPTEDPTAGLWRGVALNSATHPIAGWFPPTHWIDWPLVDPDRLPSDVSANYYEALFKWNNGDYAVL
jgi:hypothetical protein